MKVRTGFVSNSSTSSFVCIFAGMKLSDFAEGQRVMRKRTKYDEDTGKLYEVEEEFYRTFVAGQDITEDIPPNYKNDALEYQIHGWLSPPSEVDGNDQPECLRTFGHDADGYPGCYVGMPILQTHVLRAVVGFPNPSTMEEKKIKAEMLFRELGCIEAVKILLLTETSS